MEERKETLLELVKTQLSPTLIYCQAPASANRVTLYLIEEAGLSEVSETKKIAAWISKHYQSDARLTHLQINTNHAKVVAREESERVSDILATGSVRRRRQQAGCFWRTLSIIFDSLPCYNAEFQSAENASRKCSTKAATRVESRS
jgi:hypothetical protein